MYATDIHKKTLLCVYNNPSHIFTNTSSECLSDLAMGVGVASVMVLFVATLNFLFSWLILAIGETSTVLSNPEILGLRILLKDCLIVTFIMCKVHYLQNVFRALVNFFLCILGLPQHPEEMFIELKVNLHSDINCTNSLLLWTISVHAHFNQT